MKQYNKIALVVFGLSAIWITGRGIWVHMREPDAFTVVDIFVILLCSASIVYSSARATFLFLTETFK